MLAELRFDGCRVPKENLLGRVGFGVSHVCAAALEQGRYSVAWGSVGIGQACVDASRAYASERRQFGVPLADHQLIRRLLTDMIVNVRAARLLCLRAGWLRDAGDPGAFMETMAAKYFASTIAVRAANDAVQIHGANGISDDFPVGRYLRDSRVIEIIEGSTQIQQITIPLFEFQELCMATIDLEGASHAAAVHAAKKKEKKSIKCVVWDLDNTVWDGILLEDAEVQLRPHVVHILKTLDERGILYSIASRNDHDSAMHKLEELGIDEYFLYPQINWGSKAASIAQIAKDINIGLDAIAFVDDQPFEREEVAFSHADVLCVDSALLEDFLDRPRVQPPLHHRGLAPAPPHVPGGHRAQPRRGGVRGPEGGVPRRPWG